MLNSAITKAYPTAVSATVKQAYCTIHGETAWHSFDGLDMITAFQLGAEKVCFEIVHADGTVTRSADFTREELIAGRVKVEGIDWAAMIHAAGKTTISLTSRMSWGPNFVGVEGEWFDLLHLANRVRDLKGMNPEVAAMWLPGDRDEVLEEARKQADAIVAALNFGADYSGRGRASLTQITAEELDLLPLGIPF